MIGDYKRGSRLAVEYGFKPFAIAGAFVQIALLVTCPLQRMIAYPFVFLFFGAITGSTWFSGFIAGFMATIMSGVLISFFFIPPVLDFNNEGIPKLFNRIHLNCPELQRD